MNIYAKVREFLLARMGETWAPRDIALKLGESGTKVSTACSTLFAQKTLHRERVAGIYNYRMNPEWKPRKLLEGTRAERQKLHQNSWHKKRAAAGLPRYRSPGELRKAAESHARAEARRAAFAEVKAKREAEKAERQAKLSLERKSRAIAVVAKNAEKRSIKPAPKTTRIAPAKPAQTVEEFLAQGGKIERLPRGATSGRLAA